MVINVTRIGDTLLTTPALRAISKTWPGAQIDVLGHPKRFEVLQHLPFLHYVGSISKKTAPLRGWLSCLRKPYDLAIVYGYDKSLVRYALRVARRVVAFRQNDASLNELISVVVEPHNFQADHAVRLAMLLPEAVGVVPCGERIAYCVSEEENRWAKATLARNIPVGAGPLIGVQVASFPTKAYRDWPIESFKELCSRIRDMWPKAHFLIFGGAAEQQRTEALKDHLGEAATLYAGRLSLRQTGALMSKLNCYIGVDTGPTHLMSSFDIPLVGLYHGYSRSEVIGPLDHPLLYAIDHPQAGPNCPTDALMADISVDQVWQVVQKALSSFPTQSAGQ